MELHELIIHRIDKTQASTEANVELREETLPTDKLAVDFISSVRDTYSKRSSLKYGSFHSNEDSYPFQGMMRDYLNPDGAESPFLNFSHRATRHLKKQMETERMATGGYIVFAHFDDDEAEYILCLMVDNTEGFAVDEDLELLEQIHLDIEDLQIASRVNVDDWRNNEEGHVSFIPGTKAVSRYFQSFVGVEDSTSSKEATRRAKEAIEAYFEDHEYTEQEKEQVYNQVGEYLKECLNSGNAATVDALSHVVDHENPERFQQHAISDEYRVSSTFAPSRKVINSIQRYEVQSDGIDLRFEKSLFRERVTYNVDNRVLSINQLSPEDLPQDLRRELNLE